MGAIAAMGRSYSGNDGISFFIPGSDLITMRLCVFLSCYFWPAQRLPAKPLFIMLLVIHRQRQASRSSVF